MARASLKLKSASCQIAYWKGGRLRISNYLARRTFSTNPATLDLIRFFFTPRTIQDALAPLVETVMRAGPGTVQAKAALAELGVIPHASVRLPLVEAITGPAAGRPKRAIPTPS